MNVNIETNNKVDVVIYARFSSHNQTEQSIEGQLKVCYEYCKRNGYYVVHEYIDRALSGTTDRRPEFQKMIYDSKFKKFKFVIVYQLDRFARDRYDSATYKHKLSKNGVKVLSAKENINDDASGILMESVLEGMAEYYSAELGQKIKRGMELTAQKGKSIGGQRLFGFNINANKEYVINKDEAPWVEKIFNWYGTRKPMVEIANELNLHHVTTTKGKKWDCQGISKLLSNRKYIGEINFKGQQIKDCIPRIVSDQQFDKAQQLKSMSKHLSYKAKELFYLTGRIKCAKCGSNMVGQSSIGNNGVRYFYYKCINHIKRKKCSLPAIPKEELENSVINNVRQVLTDSKIELIVDKAIEKHKKNSCNKLKIAGYRKEVKELNEKIEKFTDLLIQSRNIDLIMDKIDECKLKISELEQKIFDEEMNDVEINRDLLILKIKNIRDFDFNQPDAKVIFIESFVRLVTVDENKKITVTLKLDDSCSNNITSNIVNPHTMVELKRIELSTS